MNYSASSPGGLQAKRRRLPKKNKVITWAYGYAMVAPTIIGLIILNIVPIFQTIYMSFFKSGAFGKGNIFIGFSNYATLFADKQVWQAALNTLKYALLVVPVGIILSLLLATALNKKIAGRGLYRLIYFMPMIAVPAAVTMVWRWLYNYYYGLFNHLLTGIGLDAVKWIEEPNLALFSIALIGIWSSVGYNMVLILSGLQEIPKDFYEASELDGASPFRQLVSITIPLVSPTLFFVSITSVISAMQVFDVIYMLIDVANPAYKKTVSLVYLFYNNSFKYSNKGYASCIVLVLLVIILILTLIQNKLQKKWVHYM